MLNRQAVSPYHKILTELEAKVLDPDEERRETLLQLIADGLEALPVSERQVGVVGRYITREPDLTCWEVISDDGVDQKTALVGAVGALIGQPRWHVPSTMHNINPAPMLGAVAASTIANLYNPNLLWDFTSAGVQAYEKQIVRQVSRLAGWDENKSDGVSTFGGKGCLTYAVKVGLNRALHAASTTGLKGAMPVVLASGPNHYSISTVCALLGIGSDNWMKIPTSSDDKIDISAFGDLLEDLIRSGRPIACIIASGGNTLDLTVDPLEQMREAIDAVVKKHELPYTPFLYFDTVVTWPWLFFQNYDWAGNALQLPDNVLEDLRSIYASIKAVKLCDGFGIDFHKTGFSPYTSSLFMCRRDAELQSIFRSKVFSAPRQPHGNNFAQHHTIEHSRSASSVLSAWFSLQAAGVNGYRVYLARLSEIAVSIRTRLKALGFEHLNINGKGFASVFWIGSVGSPLSYQQLLQAPREIVEASNRRIFALFDELAVPRDANASVILRYLPQFATSESGEMAATLVVYPMSISTTDADLQAVVDRIRQVADRILQTTAYDFDFRFNPPSHVPR